MNKKMILLGFGILIILCLFSCNGEKSKNSDLEQKTAVKVQKVELSTAERQNYYVGIVEESVSVPVSFSLPGQVSKVYVKEGQKVKKGQILAELINSNYQSIYKMNLAKEIQAEDANARLSDLYKKGSLPEIKYIEIQTGVEQARLATQIALKNLTDCKLYSPIDGVVGKRSIEPGMQIIPAISNLTIVKINKVYVKVSVPENEISKVEIGQKVQINVAALDNEQFVGIIEEKGVMANTLSHTYDIKIALQNQEEKLMPGMVTNVYFKNSTSTSCIVIPNSTISSDNENNKFVFVIDKSGKIAKKRTVLIGKTTNAGIIINTGLKEGDILITEGYQKLTNNSPISIIN
jgi:membrane fusion protein, multidrug efflux system